MLSVASLRKRFDDRCRLRAVEVKAAITESGLVLGAGTLLVRMGKDRFGLPMLAFVQDGERVHTLLTVAQRRPPSADFYRHLQSAAEYWRRGDKALANLRLAFARLPQLESELDAWRLYLAAELLDEGVSPRRLLRELGYDSGDVHKYDPDEPRVPAGSGRESGEWSSGEGGSSPSSASGTGRSALDSARDLAPLGARVAASFLDEIGADVLSGLTAFASRFAGPAAFFGAIFIPSPNNGTSAEGSLPETPNVRYKADYDTGILELTSTGRDGNEITVSAQLRNGVYVDVKTGKSLGRDLDGTLYIDHDAATSALRDADGGTGEGADAALGQNDDEPKLCPEQVPDNPGATYKDYSVKYAQYVSQEIVNPQRFPPLQPGMAFGLFNPISGKMVLFDDCQDTTGQMHEYKGHYADILDKDFLQDELRADFLDQAYRQTLANDFRNLQTGLNNPVEWDFDEKETADFAWKLFEREGYLPRIRVCYAPYRLQSDYNCYPDP